MIQKIYLILFLIISFLYIGCKDEHGHDHGVDPPLIIDENFNGFPSREVAEVLINNCATSGCHYGVHTEHNLSLANYNLLLKGSLGRSITGGHDHGKTSHSFHETGVYGGEVIVPFRSDRSLLYNLLIGNIVDSTQRMPYKLEPLSNSQIQLIKNWIDDGARNFQGKLPFENSIGNIYVNNQGSDEISVINSDYKVVSRIINVDFNPNGNDSPHNIQIHNEYLYATLINTGKLIKIRKSDNQIIAEVNNLGFPGMIELTNDGRTAYVSRSSTVTGSYSTIYVIDTESMTLTGEITIPVSGIPHGIALSHDDSKLYIANMSQDRITIINLSNNEPEGSDIRLATTSIPQYEPMHIYTSKDGTELYTSCRKANKILIIDAVTRLVKQEIQTEDHPMQMAVSSDGNSIYVSIMHHAKVLVLRKSGNNWVIFKEILHPSFSMVYGCDISKDGKFVYVTNSNQLDSFMPHYLIKNRPNRKSTVTVIDTQINEVVKVIDVGSYATGITVDKSN